MPLLMFISAYLYSSLHFEQNKYQKYKDLIINKFKRLLLPAYIFGILFMLTLGNHNWMNIFNGYNHLWYLPALFWCFVISPWIIKINNLKIQLLILAFGFIFIYLPLPGYFGLGSFHIYFFYFYIGILLAKYKTEFYNFFQKKTNKIFLISIVLLSYLFVILFDKNGYSMQPFFEGIPFKRITIPIVRNIYRISIIMGIILYVKHLITSKNISIGKRWKFLDKTSYGLYIFHMWLMWLAFTNPYLKDFTMQIANTHYYIFPILFFIITAGLSTSITMTLQKTKIGRFLLG